MYSHAYTQTFWPLFTRIFVHASLLGLDGKWPPGISSSRPISTHFWRIIWHIFSRCLTTLYDYWRIWLKRRGFWWFLTKCEHFPKYTHFYSFCCEKGTHMSAQLCTALCPQPPPWDITRSEFSHHWCHHWGSLSFLLSLSHICIIRLTYLFMVLVWVALLRVTEECKQWQVISWLVFEDCCRAFCTITHPYRSSLHNDHTQIIKIMNTEHNYRCKTLSLWTYPVSIAGFLIMVRFMPVKSVRSCKTRCLRNPLKNVSCHLYRHSTKRVIPHSSEFNIFNFECGIKRFIKWR